MKVNWSLALSLSIHAAILIAAIVVLPEPEHFKVEEHDQIPVDIVSIEDVSMRSAMSKTAPDKTDKPAPPKVDPKQADPKPAPKAADVPKDAAKEPAPAPPPSPDKKPDPPKPDKAEPDPSQMAELLKKTEDQQKPQETQKPKPKPPTPQKPKFDPNNIAALLNKIPDEAASAPKPSDTTGTPAKGEADFLNGTDARMAANDIDWLRQKISNCWNPPVGVREAQNLVVRIRIDLAQDGTVVGTPEVMNSSADPLFNAAAGAAVRAVMGCQPYDKLPPANYEIWKEIILNFDPSQMITG